MLPKKCKYSQTYSFLGEQITEDFPKEETPGET
jgi:hypothetical protein